jgi:hypothetical protein
MNAILSPAEAAFARLLDDSVSLLRDPQDAGIAIPEDELHREILLPLLPAMLGDGAIRKHWHEQAATGFLARLKRNLEGAGRAPRWTADDFEIHVTASYLAGPDARALADTLLSEPPLREMAAALMNQLLDVAGRALPQPEAAVPAPAAVAAEVAPTPAIAPTPFAAAIGPRERRALQRLLPRIVRPNPIRGTRSSHGGLGMPDWTLSNPLRAICRR